MCDVTTRCHVTAYATAPRDSRENLAREWRARSKPAALYRKRAQCVKLAMLAFTRLLLRRRRRQKITSYRLLHERLVAFIVSIRHVGRGRLDQDRSETGARPRINAIYAEISSLFPDGNSPAGMTFASMYASSDDQSVGYVHRRLPRRRRPPSATTANDLYDRRLLAVYPDVVRFIAGPALPHIPVSQCRRRCDARCLLIGDGGRGLVYVCTIATTATPDINLRVTRERARARVDHDVMVT